jgi:hypothetical protein
MMERPVLRYGSKGSQVQLLQQCFLDLVDDGLFGRETETEVSRFQTRHSLTADGVVGPDTWEAMDRACGGLPAYPPPLPALLDIDTVNAICAASNNSPLASYYWRERGVAPSGYTNGMAVAFAVAISRWSADDDGLIYQMAKAIGSDDVDALSWYNSQYRDLGMSNYQDGIDTLRHLYALLIGLGMRESSGRHCEGRDMAADNVTSDTCEAGLFQTSWNASSCHSDMQVLFDQYSFAYEATQFAKGYVDLFKVEVECSDASWSCYGSGDGLMYQQLAKAMPLFAVETTAIGLRYLRQHWGPINRQEVELRAEADDMLQEVQAIMNNRQPVA